MPLNETSPHENFLRTPLIVASNFLAMNRAVQTLYEFGKSSLIKKNFFIFGFVVL